MRAIRNKVIVKIDKKLQNEKREKIGSLYIPSHLMDYQNNLQWGIVVDFGPMVKDVCPEIEQGCIAIFIHTVEHKVINRNVAEGNTHEEEGDTHLLGVLENGDELRSLSVSNDIGSELFGVFKNGKIYPCSNIVFCSAYVKKTGYQMVKGIYLNSEVNKSAISDSIDVIQHGINEYARVLSGLPENENTYEMRENLVKEISNLQKRKKDLQQELKKINLVELSVVASGPDNLKNGDTILANEKFLYPLNVFDASFAILRDQYSTVYAKVKEGVIEPINDRVILTPVNSDTKNMAKTPSGEYTLYHPLGMVEIFIDDQKKIITHKENCLAVFPPLNVENK